MSRFSSMDCCCTCEISRTTLFTMSAPASALLRAFSDEPAAVPALRATSMTEAFISSMEVAVSATRLDCSSAPRSDCSIWAESSSEAEETTSTTPSSFWAAWIMPSRLAFSARLRASSASAMACTASRSLASASTDFSSASAILPLRVATMACMAWYTPDKGRSERKLTFRLPAAISVETPCK